MAIVPITLPSRSNPARYLQGGSARIVNGYREDIGDDGRVAWMIRAADGLEGFADLIGANGGVRCMLEVEGYLYVVAGTQFWRVATNGDTLFVGSMSIDATAPVYIERNRRTAPDIMISCAGIAYYYRAGTLAQITDGDLLSPTSHTFLDGYFVLGTSDNTWQIGALDDAANWDALDFERADANPDPVVRVSALQRDAVIFGTKSTEFHRNTGAADFPFERVAAIDIGILAADSVASVEQMLAFVAHDRTVRMLAGYQAQRISTHAVERDIEALTDKSLIRATSWERDGHTFYCISTSSWTWVYDTVSGHWHNRESYNDTSWRISKVATFGDKVIAGDRDSGTLYVMSSAYQDEAGQPLVLSTTVPTAHAYPHRLTVHEAYCDVERGVGTGQGAAQDIDPSLMFEWSRDGGATFQGPRMLPIGAQGERTTRVRTRRLGQAKEGGFVFRLSCSAKVARAIYGLHADITQDAA